MAGQPKTRQKKQDVWRDFVTKYYNDPVGFCTNAINLEALDWQKDVMVAVSKNHRRLSIRSGHGVGKSTCAAALMVWYLLTRYPAKIVVTAPTASQLYDALFAEVKRRIKEMPKALSQLLEMTTDRIVLKASPTEAFISARTSSKERPEAMAGVHSENVLLIFDEASGIPEEVFESAAGSMSGHNATTLLLGNPIRTSGMFYRTQTELTDDWWTRAVSCKDNPLVSEDFIKDMASRYGDSSNAFRCRVLGEFPLAEEDTLIPMHLVEAAIDRDIKPANTMPVVWGLDIARQGMDRTALCKRRGNVILEPIKTWRDKDLMETVGLVLNEYETTPYQDRPQEILADVIGIGAGVVDRINELNICPCRGVNVAEASPMKDKYNRLRDQLWAECKTWFEERECSIPQDDALIAELTIPKYNFTTTGKLKVEAKQEMKKRGFASPDVADALVLTFAASAMTAFKGNTRYNWNRAIDQNLDWVV
ncbi:MAG: putative terminase large subunit [Prokaryotic dsDNA virus sp.]|nr:MAG: putative terminase large subunit [Prokaryotic dsDNA virus sp.]